MDAEKAGREEAEKKASDDLENLKNEHYDALVQAREEGYDKVISGAADEMDNLKNTIYEAGYEFSLDSVSISDDHELYKKIVLNPLENFSPRLMMPTKKTLP